MLTQQHQNALNKLSDFLNLRRHRLDKNLEGDVQLYGGLGGVILEGEPGIGKSEIVSRIIKQFNLKEGDISQTNADADNNVFYKVPANMDYEDKRNLLLKAFDEGAVVIIDEINSCPMMESLLNDLLMGKSPNGKRPDNPGFMIIGTQNPANEAGRSVASNALLRRTHPIQLPSYTKEEMKKILVHKGLGEFTSEKIIEEYTKAKEINPKLCFRDMLRETSRVIDLLKTKRAKIESKEVFNKKISNHILSRTFHVFLDACMDFYNQLNPQLEQLEEKRSKKKNLS